MKKSELIKELSRQCELSNKKTKELINALTAIITRELINGEKVNIDRLGSFRAVEYTGRPIISIEGKEIIVEDHFTPRFVPSQTLKKELKSRAANKNNAQNQF